MPEIAFAGRSNVGKSSLLNALTNRKALARTSNTPGRTQELNIFDVGKPLVMRLVDMPGYGFAEAPRDLVKRWRFLVNDYLRGRQVLKRALVLVDARHGFKDVDHEVMSMLDAAAVSYHVVLTKADKIKPTALADAAGGDPGRSRQASRVASGRCSRRRAKPEPASPSYVLRSSTPSKSERAPRDQAYHRQPGLFELVDARLAGDAPVGARVRGTGRSGVRRGMGTAPRGR